MSGISFVSKSIWVYSCLLCCNDIPINFLKFWYLVLISENSSSNINWRLVSASVY